MRERIEQIERLLQHQTDQKERDLAKRYASLLLVIHGVLGEFFRRYEVDGRLTYVEMVKYDRLRRMEAEIIELINSEDKAVRRDIVRHLENQYQEAYYRVAHVIETKLGARLNDRAVRRAVPDVAINSDLTGVTLNERLESRRQDLIYNMKGEFVRCLSRDKTYRQMFSDMMDELDGDLVKA